MALVILAPMWPFNGNRKRLYYIIAKLQCMANALQNLQQEVAENKSATQSAITLLNGLKARLDEAIANGDMSQVQALSDELSANTDQLAAAVTANTPAEDETNGGDGTQP